MSKFDVSWAMNKCFVLWFQEGFKADSWNVLSTSDFFLDWQISRYFFLLSSFTSFHVNCYCDCLSSPEFELQAEFVIYLASSCLQYQIFLIDLQSKYGTDSRLLNFNDLAGTGAFDRDLTVEWILSVEKQK